MHITNTEKVLERLRRNTNLAMYAHFGAANRNNRYHMLLGVPLLIINLAVGSVLIGYIGEEFSDLYKWISAVFSLIAAILSSLITFFRFNSGKEKHREIAIKYLSVDRKAEQLLALYKDGLIDLKKLSAQTQELNKDYEKLNKDASHFPTTDRDYNRAKEKIQGRTDLLDQLFLATGNINVTAE